MYLRVMNRRRNEVTKADIYLYHGWALWSGVWDELVSEITKALNGQLGIETKFHIIDRGYYGKPKREDLTNGNGLNIIISHSLGLHHVPVSLLHKADLLVSIGGFLSFHDFDGKKTKTATKLMSEKLHQDPQGLINDFFEKLFHPHPLPNGFIDKLPGPIDIKKLESDLELLNESELSGKRFPETCQIRVFHGEQDAIVSSEHARKWMKGMNTVSGRIISDEGHALLFTHTTMIANTVKRVVDQIIKSAF